MPSPYTANQLTEMVRLFEKSASGCSIDRDWLLERLAEIFRSDEEETTSEPADPREALWNQFQIMDEEERLPHQEMAAFYREAIGADDPIAVIRQNKDAELALTGPMRHLQVSREYRGEPWPYRAIEVDWAVLSASAQKAVIDEIDELRIFEEAHSRRGARRKLEIDAYLYELAHLFGRTFDTYPDVLDVPHAENSDFIKFAVIAMEASGRALTERHASPIWQRWRDYKKRAKARSHRHA